MQRRRYKNPPIEEALCEFRFHPDQEWNLTIPGRLHGELADEYSGKPQEQKVANITLNAQEGQRDSVMKKGLQEPNSSRRMARG